MKVSILFFLVFICVTKVAAQNVTLFPAEFTPSTQKDLIDDIQRNSCTRANKEYSKVLRKKISSRTMIICISGFAYFDPENYKHEQDVVPYLEFTNKPVLWLINPDTGVARYSLFAIADNSESSVLDSLSKSCYFLTEPKYHFVGAKKFNILKPILNKIDLKHCSLFTITGNRTDLFVLKNNQVYIIKGDKLIPFYEYYRNYSLKELKKTFVVELR